MGEGGLQNCRLIAERGRQWLKSRISRRLKEKKKVVVSPEPVCEGHHDIQRGQEEDEVEEEVAVGHSLGLVVNNLLTAFGVIVNH